MCVCVCACAGGQATRDTLAGTGFAVDLKLYTGMGHAASQEELDDVLAWLAATLPEPTTTLQLGAKAHL